MTFPAGEGATFEVIQPDLVLEFLILLLDGPALMGEAHEHAQRCGRRQVHQAVLRPRVGAEVAFAQQPDCGCEPQSLPPIVKQPRSRGSPTTAGRGGS